jgi:hypothetical protein
MAKKSKTPAAEVFVAVYDLYYEGQENIAVGMSLEAAQLAAQKHATDAGYGRPLWKSHTTQAPDGPDTWHEGELRGGTLHRYLIQVLPLLTD